MFTAWLRKTFRGVIEGIAGFFVRLGLTADALTILGCLMNIAVAVILALGHLRLGGILLAFASVFDAFDGAVARGTGGATKFGPFLDSTLDRISESAVVLGLAIWYMGQPGLTGEILAYVTLVGSWMVSYTRGRAEGLGVECKVGLFTRVERCITLVAGLVLGLQLPMLWILAIGTPLTGLQRVWHVYQQSKGQLIKS